MQFLVTRGMSDRVEALAFKVWRESILILNMICAADFKWGVHNFHIIQGIRARVAHFEAEYYNLKEITTILELALWKSRMSENIPQEEVSHCQNKMKTDETEIRRQCRITCRADVIIGHVIPFLISTED